MFRFFDEILKILYLFYFIFSYAYLHYAWHGTHIFLDKTEFHYNLNDLKKTAIIYRKRKNVKKVILFLSGAYNLENHAYISKLMHDLEVVHGEIMQEYELICFEKSDQSSIIIYDDVFHYIKQLNDELGGIEELTLFGFSAGGCVASHIMQRCKSLSFKKKIITYDTPWQVQDNVEYFQENYLYRPDILFFWKVHHTYSTHYNYEDIKQHLEVKSYLSGARELVEIIRRVHNYSLDEMLSVTQFNFDQTEDTKVYNIISKYDPFVVRAGVHDKFVNQNKDKIKFKNKIIEKKCIGHCSDMGFSTSYLNEVMFAIRD